MTPISTNKSPDEAGTSVRAKDVKAKNEQARRSNASLCKDGVFVPVVNGENGGGLEPSLEGDSPPVRLPCLNSNNSIEKPIRNRITTRKDGFEEYYYTDENGNRIKARQPKERGEGYTFFTHYEEKSIYILRGNIESMIKHHGVENCGFLTLTFPDNLRDFREAQKRFNSLASNLLRKLFPGGYIVVLEPQKRGAIHYHLIVGTEQDIRTGFDFEAVSKRDYRSANDYLRGLWSQLRNSMDKYGFGRSELLPIKTTGEGIAKYVGKYLQKNFLECPTDWAKSKARKVRYSRSEWRTHKHGFQFISEGSARWRQRVGAFAERVGAESFEDLRELFGPRWAYFSREYLSGDDEQFQDFISLMAAYLENKEHWATNCPF